ncbi:MAG: hypothetical protein JWN07_1223, partial [Hyphomicrobiales bacterium]|nr:hypothetical protein [Hyphomicrobiales bacterium]
MKDGADGFALLETVVAAALLALLFAIYLPSVLRAPGQAQFQADMTQAMSVLRTARAAAQTSQRDVMVAFDPARHALVSSGARAATIHPRTSVELRATGSA